jgi:hypothetical protein
MTLRIQRALQSGKLKRDQTYTIPALAILLGTSRANLRQAGNREFGSIANFYAQAGLVVAVVK